MTKRTWLYIGIVILALILVVGLVFLLRPIGNQTQQPANVENNTTAGTTEVTDIPGMEDSIFDGASVGDKREPVAGQQDTTVPQESTAGNEDDPTAMTTVGAVSGGNQENDKPSGGQLPAPGEMTYEEFVALSPADQRRYQDSFGKDDAGLEAFFDWYIAAKEKYEQENPVYDVGDGVIDLGKLPT